MKKAKKTVRDIEVEGKRVLVRVDFNVPLDKTGAITDDSRIQASLPTIQYLLNHKAKVILCSHLGRPDGKVVESLRLRPVALRLSKIIRLPVQVTADCIGPEAEDMVNKLKEGEILLLENLRFHPGDEANDIGFAQALARLADIFVNDAFGTAHRAHASTVGVARYLPTVAGLLMERELEILGKVLETPEHPFGILLGGAKVSDKVGLIVNIAKKADLLLIGGAMAATFLKAKGLEIGHSQVEEDKLGIAKEIMVEAEKRRLTFLLPVDVLVTENQDTPAKTAILPVSRILPYHSIVDIGPETISLFSRELEKCRMVLWNGPLGIFEVPQFAQGTIAIARFLAHYPGITIVGGGSTAEVVQDLGLTDKMTHVSTGGGAALMLLEGRTLPAVEVLPDK